MDLLEATRVPLGGIQWAQPSKYEDVLTKRAPGGDPSIANVVLHSVACVRELVGGPGVDIQLPQTLATEALAAPRVTSVDPLTPLTPPLPCDSFTVGRGSALPWYRVKFRDGTNDAQTLFVDGSCALALPAEQVEIDLALPENAIVRPPVGQDIPIPNSSLFADVFARASVSWSSRAALAGGPSGYATFTQRQLTLFNGGDPDTPLTMYFERPPFAKEVCLLYDPSYTNVPPPPPGLALTARFVAGGTFGLEELGGGQILGGTLAMAVKTCVPLGATHVEVVPDPALATPGAPVTCVWLIGVE